MISFVAISKDWQDLHEEKIWELSIDCKDKLRLLKSIARLIQTI